MAATDVFMISSSPPRQFKNYSLMSSSPPSLEELVKKRPQALRSGSQAVPIPQNALASFTSAATFLKPTSSRATTESAFATTLDTPNEQKSDLPPKNKSVKSKIARRDPQDKLEDGKGAKKLKENTTKVTEKKDEGEPKRKARKARIKQLDNSAEDAENQPTKAPRKRAKKAVVDDTSEMKENLTEKTKKVLENDPQTKLSKGKVTKASSKLAAKPKNIIGNEQGLSQIKSIISDDPFTESMDFGLDEAVKRRSHWTPPKRKSTVEASVSIEGSASTPGSMESDEKNGFSDLLKNYGLTKTAAPIRIAKALEGAGTRKRKLIELVSANPLTTSISPPKAKVTLSKKARTITDLATSAYIEEVEDSARQGQLLQFLSLPSLEISTGNGFKVPEKPKSRSKSSVKRGHPKKNEYILLSPQSALKEVGDQDFVFGTSSQLAREESPTLLRDLQEAMQASNEIDDIFAELNDFQSPPGRRTNISRSKSLWGAAARDEDCNATNDKTRRDINKSNSAQATIFSPIRQIEKAIKSDFDSPSNPILTKDTPGQKPADKVSKRPSKPAKPADLEMPNFESYTTAQLAKEVASYRFKPIKSRTQMIVLLEKCWEGKHRPALGILGTNKIIEPSGSVQQKEKSAKRPRGRPRNDATATPSPKRSPKSKKPPKQNNFEDMETSEGPRSSPIRTPMGRKKLAKPVEDISDSEAEHTPSPRRRSGSSSKFASLPLKHYTDADVDDIATSQELVFSHITRAVKAAPRSTDSVNPSWHEKILLYDPIIIEDLTAWLNTGAMQKVGWDDEVEPKEVKKWCESKSICCLWKENLRGGARSHY